MISGGTTNEVCGIGTRWSGIPSKRSEIIHTDAHPVSDLAPVTLPADRNPCAVYIARLGSPHSRRAMTGALRKIAGLLTSGACTDPLTFPWWQ